MDNDLQPMDRLVLPRSRRQFVLKLAHDHTGHFSTKKVKDLINSRFTWPRLTSDVENVVRTCESCLKVNKAGNKAVKLVERPVISEPYESVAFDIVGPLPKGKEEPHSFLPWSVWQVDGLRQCH